MLTDAYRNAAADYGNGWSVQLGTDGAIKQADGPVMCKRAAGSGWGYNGNPVPTSSWGWHW